MKGRVLIIAGSDPSGGAGIQADIKTVTALGGYAATAVTAITVQNTKGVSAVHSVAPDVIAAQIEAVLSDIGADAIKIGMIGELAAAAVIEAALLASPDIPVVLDPVLAATSGDALASGGVAGFIRERLAPLCATITPNADEAAVLTGQTVSDSAGMVEAGQTLLGFGAKAALVKGGHLLTASVEDVFVYSGGAHVFSHPRIDTTSTHGTGCTLSSAIAVGLAQGMNMSAAVERAINYVQKAIKTAPGFGAGHGPLNHNVRLEEGE